jgi:hypothetical protein
MQRAAKKSACLTVWVRILGCLGKRVNRELLGNNIMKAAGGPRADLAEVAKALNVSEAALKAALPGRMPAP